MLRVYSDRPRTFLRAENSHRCGVTFYFCCLARRAQLFVCTSTTHASPPPPPPPLFLCCGSGIIHSEDSVIECSDYDRSDRFSERRSHHRGNTSSGQFYVRYFLLAQANCVFFKSCLFVLVPTRPVSRSNRMLMSVPTGQWNAYILNICGRHCRPVHRSIRMFMSLTTGQCVAQTE